MGKDVPAVTSSHQLTLMIPRILKGIKAPVNHLNHQAMVLWANSEGEPDNTYNPWATTEGEPGATDTNSVHVKKYKDLDQGVKAMIDTLHGHNFVDIKKALIAGKSLDDIYAAINSSKWCGGCQNHRYPVQLWQALGHQPHRRSPGTEPLPVDTAKGESWGPHVKATAANFVQDRPTTQGATDAIRGLFT